MVRISDPPAGGTDDDSDDGGSSGGGGGGGDGDGGGDDLPDRTQDQLDRLDDTAPEPTDPDSGGDSGDDTPTVAPSPGTPGYEEGPGGGGGGSDDDGGDDTTEDTQPSPSPGPIGPIGGGEAVAPSPGTRTTTDPAESADRQQFGDFGEPEQTGIETGTTPRGSPVTSDLQRRAQAFERQLIAQNPNIQTAEDVNIRFREGQGLTAEFTTSGERRVRSIQREQAASILSERTGVSVGATQVERTEEGFVPTGEPAETIAEEQAAEQVQEQAGRQEFTDVPEGTPRGIQRVVGREAGNLSAEDARELSDLERGRDFTVDASGDEVDVQFTEGYFERQLTDELDIAAEAGEDFTIEETAEGGQRVQLTAEGRQDAITSQLLSRGEIEVDRPSATIGTGTGEGGIRGRRGEGGELLGPGEEQDIVIGGGTRTIDIERASQLEFDEEGNLVDVSAPVPTEAEERAARERLAEAVPVVGDFVSDFAFESRELLQSAGDVSTDVGSAFTEEVVDPTAAFYEDVGDAVFSVGRAAGATAAGRESAGDLQEQAAQQTLDVSRGESGRILAAQSPALGDFKLTETEDVAEATAVGEQTGDFARGVSSIGRFAIELPDTAATGAEVGGQAAAFTVENPIAAPGAAAGTAVNVGENIAVQTIQSPAKVAGQLVGSAGVFGAARAVGTRTSLATRLAIQPGEEILGYGGYGLTRRVAGQRAADRLFPQQEPLIFSEEAAIRTARHAGRAARRGGARLRTEVGERTPSPSEVRSETVRRIRETRRAVGREIHRRRVPRPEMGRSEVEITETELEEGEIGVVYDPTRRFLGSPYEVETESETEDELPSDIDGEGDGGGTVGGTVSFEVDLGRGQVAEVEQRVGTGTDPLTTEMQVERAREIRRGRQRRRETAIQLQEEELSQPSELLEEVRLEDTLVSEMQPELELPMEIELEQELERELETEIEQETEIEAETESELEQEIELEIELEQELERELETEIELEIEPETELETEIERDDREEEDDFLRDFDADDFTEEFQYDVAAPGELLEGDSL